jgi:hypothetical protein
MALRCEAGDIAGVANELRGTDWADTGDLNQTRS